jgi:hypothetical protein
MDKSYRKKLSNQLLVLSRRDEKLRRELELAETEVWRIDSLLTETFEDIRRVYNERFPTSEVTT